MDIPSFFSLLIPLSLMALASYAVISASMQRRWMRAVCITTMVLTGFIVLSFIALPIAFSVLFALLYMGLWVFLLVAVMMAIYHKRWKLAVGIVTAIIAGWSALSAMSKPAWRDGDIMLDKTEEGRPHLVRELSGGGYIEVVSEDVIAVGSDKNWIVAKQSEPVDGSVHCYIFPKDANNLPRQDAEKRLTPEAFEKVAAKWSLPPFSWTKE